jgi:hypothetical protein
MPSSEMDRIMNGVSDARDILAMEADAAVFEKVQELYSAGKVAWRMDPQVDGVVGLIDLKNEKALILVNLDERDFETSVEFDKMVGEKMYLVCRGCGEACDDIGTARDHGVSNPQSKTWCGEDGFDILPESEAM